MLADYRDLIDELLGTPKTLRDRISGGDRPAAEVLRLVDELRARDEAVVVRLNTMLRQRDAVLGELALEIDPAAGDADPAALLSRFDQARGELVSLLMNLTIKDWSATAIGANGQQTDVSEEVENHVEFDESHVARITGDA
ncbi:MAG TPA: hypothetical protein VGT61_10935 [Thermomicrobiales bacterium]|jgi:hypothetical protein|nr:hypothetical protein [Thermomicrobiales bacterium]